jgi:hypothetical protein
MGVLYLAQRSSPRRRGAHEIVLPDLAHDQALPLTPAGRALGLDRPA